MDKLKEYVDKGKVQIARMNSQQKPVQVQFSELERTVQSQNDMAKIYQSLQELSSQEKYEWTNFKRLRGNQLYKQGKYDQAIQVYLKALVGLDFKDSKNKKYERQNEGEQESSTEKERPTESTQQNQKVAQQKIFIKEQLMFPIILNMATCFYKKREYSKALTLCDKILTQQAIFDFQNAQHNKDQNISAAYKKIQSKFADCLFKKAYILIETGDFNQAKKLAQKLGTWEGQQSQKHRENSKQIMQIIQNKKRQQTEIYRKIFRGSQKAEQQTPFISDVNDGLIGNPEKEQILYPKEGFFEVIVDWLLDCSKGIIGKGKGKGKVNKTNHFQ